jgi:GntR family transcriptional regulator
MHVSVGTIRRAVEMLCDERLVVRSQGRGTVVSDRRSADYGSQFDRVRNADGSPIAWQFRTLSLEIRDATQEEKRALDLARDSQIIALRRLREVNGKPVKREYVRMPFELFEDIGDLRA